jgi:polyhydroxyalkanoate synthesis regulator phasin
MASAKLKLQLNSISSKIMKAEKKAEKQVKDAVKSSEAFRKSQLKNIQKVLKQAQRLKKKDLVRQAEKMKNDLEGKASKGLDFLLKTINVPSKKEIGRLSRKVGSLQKRLDALEKKRTTR